MAQYMNKGATCALKPLNLAAAAALLLLAIAPGCAVPGSNPVAGSLGMRYKDGMEMVYVPSGDFPMGAAADWDDEAPRHHVYLEGFWIDKAEVTNAQYRRCVEAGACQPPAQDRSHGRDWYYGNPEYDDYPVIYVNWYDARAYCAWAGGRIPSEAQWEKAAGGNEGREFPWGDEPDLSRLNSAERGAGDTSPVGDYRAGSGPYGALNMSGNVREWTYSLYRPYPYRDGDGREAAESSEPRVLRGGSWRDGLEQARVAARDKLEPGGRDEYTGLRCASPLALGMP
jgi:formylglycine-generating enzyme required for sulfatase activity